MEVNVVQKRRYVLIRACCTSAITSPIAIGIYVSIGILSTFYILYRIYLINQYLVLNGYLSRWDRACAISNDDNMCVLRSSFEWTLAEILGFIALMAIGILVVESCKEIRARIRLDVAKYDVEASQWLDKRVQ